MACHSNVARVIMAAVINLAAPIFKPCTTEQELGYSSGQLRTNEEEFVPQYILRVNGRTVSIDSWDPDQPLLYVLRNQLGLHGPKFGCGLGQCGACTVLLDGRPARSCSVPVGQVAKHTVTTLEGLGTPENPDPLQAAFIAEQAAQCGYCTNGMIMTSRSLLNRKAHPTMEEVKQELSPNLCRCGTHTRILNAVMRAAKA